MEEIISSGIKIFAALFLVLMNAVFVAAEFAFVKVRSTRVDQLVQQGKVSSGLVREATQKLDSYLSVSQLGITISSLGLGWIGEPAVASVIEPILKPLGLSDNSIHLTALILGFLTITFLHVVFGELAPKTVAIQRPEGTSLALAPLMKGFYYLFLPGIIVFNGTANAVVKLFGLRPVSESEAAYSSEELRMIISASTRQGILEATEEDMLEGVFELGDTVAREIMVPRPDVVSLPADMSLKKIASVAAAGNYTRYPVFEGDEPDRIIGMVHVKDILRSIESEEGFNSTDITARDLIRDVLTVPENRRIDDILTDFQRRKLQMAIVIDEWGSFEGLITIEDILEEIVGEILDEFDGEEPAIKEVEDGTYSIDGRIPIQVVNETLNSSFQSEDFETIGGLVLGMLGRAPEVGDEVQVGGHTLRVESVDGPRIAHVVARRKQS